MSHSEHVHREMTFFIRRLLPDLNLVARGIDVRFADQIKLAENLVVVVNVDQRHGVWDVAQAMISAGKSTQQTVECSMPSLALVRDPTNTSTSPSRVDAMKLPFGSGIHVIVNEPAWWRTRETISLGNAMLMPAEIGREIIVEVLEQRQPPKFRVRLEPDGDVCFRLWDASRDRVVSREHLTKEELRRHGHWTFDIYTPGQCLALDHRFSTILSFDPKVVKEAVVIRRKGRSRVAQLYVLVVAQSDHVFPEEE